MLYLAHRTVKDASGNVAIYAGRIYRELYESPGEIQVENFVIHKNSTYAKMANLIPLGIKQATSPNNTNTDKFPLIKIKSS